MRRRFLAVIAIALMMWIEYRVIMHVAKPYWTEEGAILIEVFGMVDEYDAEQF